MAKAYWSILNTFKNNKKYLTSPPLNVNGKIVSNFDKNAINNSSVLLQLEYKTNERLAFVNIKKDDICLILKNLILAKSHGWDNISIKIIKICIKANVEPLRILFLSFQEDSAHPDDWKKSHVVALHIIESRNWIKNNKSISLLPFFRKVFKRIISKFLFKQLLP